MIEVLSKSEIQGITGKTVRECQIRELNHLGIEHRERSDGSLLVFRSDVFPPTPSKRQNKGLDLSSLQ